MSMQMMRDSGLRLIRGVLVGAALMASPALAQETTNPGVLSPDSDTVTQQSGPIVVIDATAGDVQTAGANVTITGQADEISAAGANVTVRANASGDVRLAGAVVQSLGPVAGDLKIAGANVEVRGPVAGGVDAAGAVVWIGTTVGRDLRFGGANVTLTVASDIGGDVKGGAANLTIAGHVAGSAQLGAAVATISGRIDGSVEIRAAQVVIARSAVIGGDLVVYSLRDPVIEEGATVTGTVTRVAPPDWWGQDHPWWWPLVIAGAIVLGTIVAGIVLLIFGSRVFVAATSHVRHRPLSSFLLGILALVLIPFVAVILMVTVVGITVGIALLMIIPFLFVFGHAIAAAGIAAGILIRRQGDIGLGSGFVMLVIGAIALAAIGFIPFVGPILVLIALVLGVGAFTRTLGSRIRRQEVPTVVV